MATERRTMDRRQRQAVDVELQVRSHVIVTRELEEGDVDAVRQRLARWVGEGRQLGALLPEVFGAYEAARIKAQRAEEAAEAYRRQLAQAREEVEALRSERDRLQAERAGLVTELDEGLNRLVGMLQEIVQRLRAL